MGFLMGGFKPCDTNVDGAKPITLCVKYSLCYKIDNCSMIIDNN